MPKPDVPPGQAKKGAAVCSMSVEFTENPSSQTEGRIDGTISLTVSDGDKPFWSDNQTWYDCQEEFGDWIVEKACEVMGCESLPITVAGLTKREINKLQDKFHKLEQYLLDVGDITADEDKETKNKLIKEKFKAKKRK